MPQLMVDGYDLLAPAQTQLVELRQGVDHVVNILRSGLAGLPVQKIQRVVEEMGVDLLLQHLHFRALEALAHLVLLGHHFPRTLNHQVEAVDNLVDLRGIAGGNGDGVIAVGNGLHTLAKGENRFGEAAGDQRRGGQDNHQQYGDGQQQDGIRPAGDVGHIAGGGQHDGMPVRSRNAHYPRQVGAPCQGDGGQLLLGGRAGSQLGGQLRHQRSVDGLRSRLKEGLSFAVEQVESGVRAARRRLEDVLEHGQGQVGLNQPQPDVQLLYAGDLRNQVEVLGLAAQGVLVHGQEDAGRGIVRQPALKAQPLSGGELAIDAGIAEAGAKAVAVEVHAGHCTQQVTGIHHLPVGDVRVPGAVIIAAVQRGKGGAGLHVHIAAEHGDQAACQTGFVRGIAADLVQGSGVGLAVLAAQLLLHADAGSQKHGAQGQQGHQQHDNGQLGADAAAVEGFQQLHGASSSPVPWRWRRTYSAGLMLICRLKTVWK